MTFLEPSWFAWLPIVIGLAIIGMIGVALRARAISRFFGSASNSSLSNTTSRSRGVVRVCLLSSAAGLILIALARPAHSPEPKPVERSGRDVVFLIDVSRSMLASDLLPSRLERAKLAISDAMEAARGERIGLIAFAGSAVVKSPLTTDLAFARMALDQLSPDSVPRGGTAIGEAIRAAAALLSANNREATSSASSPDHYRDIFIFTDGEDHENEALTAAKEAAESGIRIIAVGLGSDLSGAQVPSASTGTPLRYEGEVVRSKMDPESLRQIAEATPGGKFFNVGTGSIEMDSVYRRLMRDAAKQTFEATPALKYTEAFQYPLMAAFMLLIVEPMIRTKKRRNT